MSILDFSSYQVIPRFYSGRNGDKIAINHDDKIYMLKFPPSGKGRKTELSYLNSCFSEHIGSTIFNMCGIKAQNTFLAKYNNKIICACEDFVKKGYSLYSFGSFRNGVNPGKDSDGSDTSLEVILEDIYKQSFINPIELEKHFWRVFIIDALIGNFDRHNDNWGFLIYDDSIINLAPVYDCGSSLLPQADDNMYKLLLENETEMDTRIYIFPTSALKYKNKKINYREFLYNSPFPLLSEVYPEVYNNIDMDAITSFIYNEELLSDLQKEFYSVYLTNRYNKILLNPSNLTSSNEETSFFE